MNQNIMNQNIINKYCKEKMNPKDDIQIEVNYSRIKKYTNFNEMYTHCRNHILYFCIRQKYIYIGVTNSPKLRCKQHLEDKGMYKMKILCETQNKVQASELEEELIYNFSDYYKLRNNIGVKKDGELILRGGVGLVEGVNYIYVLFD